MPSTRSTKLTSNGKPTKNAKATKPVTGRKSKEQNSQYFEKAEDSDASNDESEAEVKKRKAPRHNARKGGSQQKRRKVEVEDAAADEPDDDDAESDSVSAKVYDSDALDDDDFGEPAPKGKRKPRKSAESTPRKPRSPQKKKTKTKKKQQDESEAEVEFDVEEGQEVVGAVVQAPTTGRVPPGQISQNTFNFLQKLQDPKYNDRQWFKLNEPVYRLAEKEWKDFVEALTDVLVEEDPEIPHLPPKDVIHRIYRDIRFSNDKTPYKRNFSASFSRSGRKGIFAGFQPGNKTFFAAGTWCPGRNELANLRTNIQRNSQRLRSVISAPDFVQHFGKAEPHPKGESQNIFGFEDELKVAPKGVSKDDENIDLLKCRSFIVSHKFLDSEVLDPNFKEAVGAVARVVQPFVHCLNDMMTVLEEESEEGD